MRGAHVHNDLELNILLAGEMDFVFNRQKVSLPRNQFVLHWAVRPHYTVACSSASRKCSIHIPLPWVFQLQLPAPFIHRILDGDVLFDADSSRRLEDGVSVERWQTQWLSREPVRQSIVLLEVEARLRWMALSFSAPQAASGSPFAHLPASSAEKVDEMLRFITGRYAGPISSADVAKAVRLHPKYAMHLFRKNLGMTILECIAAQRIAHAQRLLLTTDLKIVDVAFQSGFGTLSRFYKVFSATLHATPQAYRLTGACTSQSGGVRGPAVMAAVRDPRRRG